MAADDDDDDAPVSATQIVAQAVSCWLRQPRDTAATVNSRRAGDTALLPVRQTNSPRKSATVSLTLPDLPVGVLMHWLGPRLIWWPQGIAWRHRTAIVSSRLGKRKDQKRWWFDALRTAVLRCDFQTEQLCYVPGTAAAAAAARASELFGMPRLRLHVSLDNPISTEVLCEWLQHRLHHSTCEDLSATRLEHVAEISPPVVLAPPFSVTAGATGPDPAIRDAAAVVAAERIVAVSCRPGGVVETLLTRQLQHDDLTAPVLLASVPGGDPVSEKLTSLGAVPWILEKPLPETADEHTGDTTLAEKTPDVDSPGNTCITGGPLSQPELWLCHWTRPHFGPWRHQPEEDFLDELILGCPTADRSALAALLRILEQQTIFASRSVRGAAATVSLTAAPLHEFRRRRVFRQHKQRYDFEPWGIAIRRPVIRKLGGRPVTYIDETSGSSDTFPDDADTASDDSRQAAFLQPRTNAQGTVDWSEEQEWRVVGDLSLANLGSRDVVAFVNSEEERFLVQSNCAWPVIRVPQE